MAWIWSDEIARFARAEMGRSRVSVAHLSQRLVCYNMVDSDDIETKAKELLGEEEEEPPLALAA